MMLSFMNLWSALVSWHEEEHKNELVKKVLYLVTHRQLCKSL